MLLSAVLRRLGTLLPGRTEVFLLSFWNLSWHLRNKSQGAHSQYSRRVNTFCIEILSCYNCSRYLFPKARTRNRRAPSMLRNVMVCLPICSEKTYFKLIHHSICSVFGAKWFSVKFSRERRFNYPRTWTLISHLGSASSACKHSMCPPWAAQCKAVDPALSKPFTDTCKVVERQKLRFQVNVFERPLRFETPLRRFVHWPG